MDYHEAISRIAGLTHDERREVTAGYLRERIITALDSNRELLDRVHLMTVDETDPGTLAGVYAKLGGIETDLSKIAVALGINPCKAVSTT
jgi:hypothetical protein